MKRKHGNGRLIAGVPLFAGCSARELDRIDSLLAEIRVRSGEVLCRKGDPGRECFIVAEGVATARLDGEVLGYLTPGSVIGEMALINGGPRTERAARARDELEAIADQLAGAVGLGGRDRKAGSAAERQRVAVTKAIKAGLSRIEEADGELGRHLAAAIKTGYFCPYAPEHPIAWNL
jgi:hypothetical protein